MLISKQIVSKQKLKDEGFRVISDTRGERIKFKIREHSLQKIPVIGVFGDKEVEEGTVTVRRFGSHKTKSQITGLFAIETRR